jgi:hypothetical protein
MNMATETAPQQRDELNLRMGERFQAERELSMKILETKPEDHGRGKYPDRLTDRIQEEHTPDELDVVRTGRDHNIAKRIAGLMRNSRNR